MDPKVPLRKPQDFDPLCSGRTQRLPSRVGSGASPIPVPERQYILIHNWLKRDGDVPEAAAVFSLQADSIRLDARNTPDLTNCLKRPCHRLGG